jgi:hypothetical protein
MAGEGVRGFVRRSLPVLLALLLTSPFAAAVTAPAASAAPAPVAAVAQVSAAPPAHVPADEVPADKPATIVVAGAPQVLHPQVTAGVRGSRAPPSTLV